MIEPGVAVQLDGRTMAVPGADWWRVLIGGNLTAVFPDSLDAEDRVWMATRLADPSDSLDLPVIVDTALLVCEHVTELPWYTAVSLAKFSEVNRVDIRGWFASITGTDLFGLPVAVGLAAVWRYTCLANLNETEVVINRSAASSGSAPLKDRNLRKSADSLAGLRRSLWSDPQRPGGEDRFDPDAEAALAASLMKGLSI